MAGRRKAPKPKVGEPNDALKWFRERVPMTKDRWLELDEEARLKAFTVAGVAKLSLVEYVMKQMAKAVENGETLEDFKDRVGGKLGKAWGGENPVRVETIFRTNIQQAYQAGRRRQLLSAGVMKERPFLRYTAILDPSVCERCAKLHGTTLPSTHGFWRRIWPPLHHRCRCTIYSLPTDLAEEAGITKRAPNVKPDEGFGSVDPLEWEQDLRGYTPELVKLFKRGK